MDPNLFHIDWERTFEALTLVIVLAFVIERALAVVFENRIFIEHFDRSGVKELLALATSIAVCVYWKFDAVSTIILTAETTIPGYVLTGAVIAGGSKASIKLFHDVLNVKSTAQENRHEIVADSAARKAESAAEEASTAKGLAQLSRLKSDADKQAERAQAAAVVSGSPMATAAAARASTAAEEIQAQVDTLTGTNETAR